MKCCNDWNVGFMQMLSFFGDVKVPGDSLAWTTTFLLPMINASPIDLLGAAAILDILKALAVNQHGISELALCEASLFEALSIKNCKITMGKEVIYFAVALLTISIF